MSHFMIENDGTVEVEAFTMLGVSSKDGQNTIGFFGSGNKYAIACALRNNIGIRIFSGNDEYVFSTKPFEFRGQDFEEILVNDKNTGLTTRMGPDWETWFILREFISNSIDEGGYSSETTEDEPAGEEGKTRIFLEINPVLQEVLNELDDKILTEPEYISYDEPTEIGMMENPGTEENFFRRGISVVGKASGNSLYWYDFKNLDISESRVYKYDFQIDEGIASVLKSCTDKSVIKNFIENYHGNREEDARFFVETPLSETWHEFLLDHRICRRGHTDYVDAERLATMTILPDTLVNALQEQWTDLDIFGNYDTSYVIIDATDEIKTIVNKAVEELHAINFHVEPEIKYIKPRSDNTVALYDRREQIIGINPDYCESVEYMKPVIMEEQFHSMGYNDGSREFENHLMKELIKSREKSCKYDRLVKFITDI